MEKKKTTPTSTKRNKKLVKKVLNNKSTKPIVQKKHQNKKPTNNGKQNLNRKPSDLKVMALGGLGEVGKNCYVVEYKNDIFVIDYGVLFPDKDLLGIDYIIPNYTYLLENKHRIRGLFITHGHEDHIGGIPFLLKTLDVPAIYAPQTASLMIQNKLREHHLSAKLIEIDDNTELKFGPVKIITYRVTHSIPDSLGLFFETPVGNIVTTGDFKVDFAPPGQEAPDFHKMTELAKRGVLLMLSDSTNAMTEGFSLSESLIGKNLKLLISEAEGRIIFTTFASNINRVEQIIEGALENKRKICIIGRSLNNALQIGLKTKYIKAKKSDIIEPRDVNKYNDNEVVIITTGSQGEALAGLSRIATGSHAHISISPSDTVVFASNPIPGNNYQVGKVLDALSESDCNIVTNSDLFKTHASGHASKEEQKLLLSLWKPKYFAPVHGTHFMLQNHKQSAIQLGIPKENIFILDNGDVLNMDTKQPYINRNVFPGQSMYVSGNNINVSTTSGIMHQLASEGVFVISAIYDNNKNLISYPLTITRGLMIVNENIEVIQQAQKIFIETYHKNKNLNKAMIEKKISSEIDKFIYSKLSKHPLIKVKLIPFKPLPKEKQAKKEKVED